MQLINEHGNLFQKRKSKRYFITLHTYLCLSLSIKLCQTCIFQLPHVIWHFIWQVNWGIKKSESGDWWWYFSTSSPSLMYWLALFLEKRQSSREDTALKLLSEEYNPCKASASAGMICKACFLPAENSVISSPEGKRDSLVFLSLSFNLRDCVCLCVCVWLEFLVVESSGDSLVSQWEKGWTCLDQTDLDSKRKAAEFPARGMAEKLQRLQWKWPP